MLDVFGRLLCTWVRLLFRAAAMKILKQIVLPLLSLMAIVGGVTFVAQYNWMPRATTQPGTPRPTDPLFFFSPMRGTQPPDEAGGMELELKQNGYLDFGLQNRQAHPATLGLQARSPSCTRVEVGSAAPTDWRTYQEWISVANAWPGAAETVSPAAAALWMSRLQWRPLPDGKKTTIPGSDASIGPAVGSLRLHWQGTHPGPERFGVELTMHCGPDGPAVPRRLEVPVLFLAALNVEPASVDIGEWRSGSTPRTVSFVCWSATRRTFTLQPADPDRHFNLACSPLSSDECRAVSQRLSDPKLPLHVRAGYQVTVTVHEHPGGLEPMDLGPLRQTLLLSSDALSEPIRVRLTGLLRGDVTVGPPEDLERVDLGQFAAARGIDRSVTLMSERPDLRLELDHCTPDYLTAALNSEPMAGGRLRWRLRLTIAPNRAAGPLPASSAVFVTVQGDTRRRLSIPVHGQAYR